MKNSFYVYNYSIKRLEDIFSKISGNSLRLIQDKSHRYYLNDYCEYIKAKTIVVENNYIDKDYLEDFSGYYARCFKGYKKTCSRIHLFSCKFNYEEFNSVFLEDNKNLTYKKLQEYYLGFIVVKPLPRTLIGRTCLKTYPYDEKRYFPVTHRCKVNIFGIELEVDSLPFQEQDSTVAACATSALWSMFQCTATLYQHAVLSPYEITAAASENSSVTTRAFPNHGLTPEAMAQAIRYAGLDPYVIEIDAYDKELKNLKSTIYAYLKLGISMILGVRLEEEINTDGKIEYKDRGQHAVAVTGYSLYREKITSDSATEAILLNAYQINKLYVHDDQIGPFARMAFSIDGGVNFLTTSWKGYSKKSNSIRAVPVILLIPLYHKIRIPYTLIYEIIVGFNSAIIEFINEFGRGILENKSIHKIENLPNKIEWDLYLIEVNKLKKEIHSSSNLKGEYYRNFLVEQMPRFIWRATARKVENKSLIVDMLFDATDVEMGIVFLRAIEYDNNFSKLLRIIFCYPGYEELCGTKLWWDIVSWFGKSANNLRN